MRGDLCRRPWVRGQGHFPMQKLPKMCQQLVAGDIAHYFTQFTLGLAQFERRELALLRGELLLRGFR